MPYLTINLHTYGIRPTIIIDNALTFMTSIRMNVASGFPKPGDRKIANKFPYYVDASNLWTITRFHENLLPEFKREFIHTIFNDEGATCFTLSWEGPTEIIYKPLCLANALKAYEDVLRYIDEGCSTKSINCDWRKFINEYTDSFRMEPISLEEIELLRTYVLKGEKALKNQVIAKLIGIPLNPFASEVLKITMYDLIVEAKKLDSLIWEIAYDFQHEKRKFEEIIGDSVYKMTNLLSQRNKILMGKF